MSTGPAQPASAQPIRCSRNFTFAEMTRSQLAIRHGLDNTPPGAACDALILLCERVLEPIRDLVGGPLAISSGYRSLEVNRLVGGAATSQHVLGQAADFTSWTSNTNIVEGIAASRIQYDQLILEGGDLGWVHVSYRPNPRHEVLAARFVNGHAVYERWS